MVNLLLITTETESLIATILYYSTYVLHFSGIAFSLVYLVINLFTHMSDLSDRNQAILRIVKLSMGLSIGFAFASSLLSDPEFLEEALIKTTSALSVIAISWLSVLVLCGVSMLVLLLLKRRYRSATSGAIRRIFKIALIGAIIALILIWLFS